MTGPNPGKRAWRTPTVGVFADVLAASNEAILYARDRTRLLEEVCRIAVEVGGFRMAWAGLADAAGDEVRVAAHCGVSAEYLERIHIALSSADPEGRGPTGTAVRERRPVVCQDFETDPRVAPWRAAAREAGFRSSAAVPLIVGTEVIGALTVYAPEAQWFADEVVEQLDELARDVAFALRALDAIERVRSSEAQARHRQHELEALFRAMTEAVVVLDQDLRIVDFNPAFAATVGQDRETLIGAGPPWAGWAAWDAGVVEQIRGALVSGSFEDRVVLARPGGGRSTADLTVTRLDEEDRLGLGALLVRPDGFVAWASDTTPSPDEVTRAAGRWFTSREPHAKSS